MELLPLRTDFDVRWRGYDHDQVQHYVHAVERELAVLTADRDAALARAESLARQLESARTENAELRARVDRICRTPIDPGALTERMRRVVELAHAEAEEITTRARSAAELVDRAHAQIEAMTRQAERRRRELDEQAAQVRRQVEADFEQAMAQRRAEAMRALADQQRFATEHAQRIVADAERRVDVLRRHRTHIAEELRAAQALLADIEPMLQSLPEEAPLKMEVIHHHQRPASAAPVNC